MSDLPSLFDDESLPVLTDQETFDYRLLSAEKRDLVLQKTDETQILLKRTAENIIKIGKNLQDVSDAMPRGLFAPWLKSEFGMSKSTAYNFMQVSRRFEGKIPKFGILSTSVLYLLSSPDVPPDAINEAIDRADSGEKITHALAQKIIEAKKAQKQAEESEAKAHVEAQIAQQALFEVQQALDARKKLDELQQEVDELATPEPQTVEVVKEVVPEAVTKQMEALQQQIKRLQEERKEQREEVKLQEERIKMLDAQLQKAVQSGVTSENDERIRQGWRLIASEAHSCLMRLLGQWPTPLDVQSFEADDWARVDHLKEMLKRVSGECEHLRSGGSDVIIEAGLVPYILNGK